MINRSALVVFAKEPFVAWMNELEKGMKDVPPTTMEDMEPSIYLIPYCIDHMEIAEWLVEGYQSIIEAECGAWYEDDSKWPELTFEEFQDWFEFSGMPAVDDLGEGEIEDEG